MCLKRLITFTFNSSEPLHLLRLMGMSVPSLHIESTNSMVCREITIQWNLRIMDTLGTSILSIVRRLSLSRRFCFKMSYNVIKVFYMQI